MLSTSFLYFWTWYHAREVGNIDFPTFYFSFCLEEYDYLSVKNGKEKRDGIFKILEMMYSKFVQENSKLN